MNNSEAYAEVVEATALGPGEDYEPRISLTISGATACSEEKADEYCAYGSNLATTGKTTYSDVYGINIEGADVASYTLYIKGDNSGKLSGSKDLASVAAANGEALTPGQWGYIIFDDPSTASENLDKTAVKQLTGTDTEVTKGQDDSEDHSTVDVTKGIAFAANFPTDAPTGHYKSAVTLSLAATPKTAVKFAGVHYMQDMTAEICKSVAPGTAGKLEDKRDGGVYAVGRLQDGNCWMTQNLRLPAGTKLTNADSNVANTSSSPYTSEVGSTGSGAYANDPDYGYWYTWEQATAGAGDNSGDASSSICPKNWVLPSGGAATVNGSFQKLYDSTTTGRQWIENGGISGNKKGWVIGGAFFPAAGASGSSNIGTHGHYWSRTTNSSSSSRAYRLYFDSSSVNPQSNDSKANGFSVRCVVETRTIDDITYMQEMTPQICANSTIWTAENQKTYTLKDKRGDTGYKIARIQNKGADTGKAHCWMTQNLKLNLDTYWTTTYMTPEYTDVKSDWTTKTANNRTKSDWSGTNTAIQYTNGIPYVDGAAYDSSYGFYYSWCAATAGDCGVTANQPGQASATQSICPAGWKLPTGGNGGDFAALFGADTGNDGITVNPHSTAAPYNYLLAGSMYTDGLNSSGSNGSYWSSSSESPARAYYLYMYSSKVWPADSFSRYGGRPVRCVLKES